jgi:hypothetical protein
MRPPKRPPINSNIRARCRPSQSSQEGVGQIEEYTTEILQLPVCSSTRNKPESLPLSRLVDTNPKFIEARLWSVSGWPTPRPECLEMGHAVIGRLPNRQSSHRLLGL